MDFVKFSERAAHVERLFVEAREAAYDLEHDIRESEDPYRFGSYLFALARLSEGIEQVALLLSGACDRADLAAYENEH